MIVPILCAITSGILWAMGGNTLSEWLNKKYKLNLHFSGLWRKLGVGINIGIWFLIANWFSWIVLLQAVLYAGAMIGAIALSGYGANSIIYNAVRFFTKNDGWWTNFITRTINGLLWTGCGFILLGSLKIAMWYLILGSLCIGLVGAGVKVAVISEILTGFIIGLAPFIKRRKDGTK